MNKTLTVSLTAAFAVLAGCAAADPTGGLLGGPQDTVVGNARTDAPKCPSGESLICETRSPNRVSDGRYGFRSNRMQGHCECHPDRYLQGMIRQTGGIGDGQQ